MKKIFSIPFILIAHFSIGQSFLNPSFETWGVAFQCEINTSPDSWVNYSNGGLGMDEANFSFCPTTIPSNATDGIVYGRSVAFGNTGEGIYQIISGFIPGYSYQISFDYAGSNLYGGLDPVQWHLFIDDADSSDTPVFQSTETNWVRHFYSFIATSSTHKIGIRLYNAPTYSSGSGGLDNFELTGMNLPVSAFSASGSSFCPGSCISFSNLSLNATSYQWIFSGANPSSDTAFNPVNICYANPGFYDVTLIASNANGNDTLTYNSYFTVYPSPPPQSITQNGDTLFSLAGASSYQWYFNSSIIAGATNYFYVATQSGNYNVVATDSNGCEVEAVINNVLAHAQLATGSWQLAIFPNPVTESLDIRGLELNSSYEISIFNVVGEKVFSAVDCKLPIGNCQLSSGLYYIEIYTDNKIFRSKFLKSTY